MDQFYTKYMIWVYHFAFNLILIFDHRDFGSSTLFFIGTFCITLHIAFWKKKNN